jgi:hypothetical protein
MRRGGFGLPNPAPRGHPRLEARSIHASGHATHRSRRQDLQSPMKRSRDLAAPLRRSGEYALLGNAGRVRPQVTGRPARAVRLSNPALEAWIPLWNDMEANDDPHRQAARSAQRSCPSIRVLNSSSPPSAPVAWRNARFADLAGHACQGFDARRSADDSWRRSLSIPFVVEGVVRLRSSLSSTERITKMASYPSAMRTDRPRRTSSPSLLGRKLHRGQRRQFRP